MKEQGGPRGFQMQEDESQGAAAPEMNFAALVLSLSASAMLQLGLESTPDAPKAVVDLPLAKQTIDILEMLREKTRGNLDESEDSLLENVLHELRMKYVELSRG